MVGRSLHALDADERPIAEAALGEPSQRATWKQLPSYFVYGTADKNIPAAALEFMAKRANSRDTVVVKAGRAPQIAGRNALGERAVASPAIAHGQIFIRTDSHVFAIGR